MQTISKALSILKVKTFVSDSPITVEEQINDWLRKNDIAVHHIGQSQSEKNGRFVFVISVFYIAKS